MRTSCKTLSPRGWGCTRASTTCSWPERTARADARADLRYRGDEFPDNPYNCLCRKLLLALASDTSCLRASISADVDARHGAVEGLLHRRLLSRPRLLKLAWPLRPITR